MSQENWTKLAPGVYADAEGTMHLVVDELLADAGWEATPENIATVQAAAEAAAKAVGASVDVMIACGLCGVALPEEDLAAQARHMTAFHPEEIARRRAESARWDGWVND